nr:HI1506-related protein [uncultured Tolumonas sp.]
MENLYLVKLHNRAHEGYRRAQRLLSKGENVLEVTDAQRAQLEADPRIAVISVSGLQPKTPDPCDGASGDMVSELVSGGVATVMPTYYATVMTAGLQPVDQPEKNAKPTRKKS